MNHMVVLEAEFDRVEQAEAFMALLVSLLHDADGWNGSGGVGVVAAPPPITEPGGQDDEIVRLRRERDYAMRRLREARES